MLQRSVGPVALHAITGASDEATDSLAPDELLASSEKALKDDSDIEPDTVMESWQLSGHEAWMHPCSHFEERDAKETVATVARNKLGSMKLEPGDDLSIHVASTFEQFSRLKKAGEGWTDNHKRGHLLSGLRGTDCASMVNVLEDPKMSGVTSHW